MEKVKAAGGLRTLLYEKGKPLERAILEALEILGFKAEQYKEGRSEFDVVLESGVDRLLGEAEGKDSKPINVDKLRQLAMNIHEDLQREEVSAPARGVLFGNGYRFMPPGERGAQFTEKCIIAAQSSSTALVTTSDIFAAIQYLTSQDDDGYAKQCRDAMLTGTGYVRLPSPPEFAQDEATEILK